MTGCVQTYLYLVIKGGPYLIFGARQAAAQNKFSRTQMVIMHELPKAPGAGGSSLEIPDPLQ